MTEILLLVFRQKGQKMRHKQVVLGNTKSNLALKSLADTKTFCAAVGEALAQ